MPCGFIAGDEETTQLHSLPPVHELSNRCAVTNHPHTSKEVIFGHYSLCIFYAVVYGLKSQQQSFYFLQLLG